MESNYDYKHTFNTKDIQRLVAKYVNETYDEPSIKPNDVRVMAVRRSEDKWEIIAKTSMRSMMNEDVI